MRRPEQELPWAFGYGSLGGILGTVLMDIVIVASLILAGLPGDSFFVSIGDKFGMGSWLGIVLHNTVGLTVGLIFAFVVVRVGPLKIDTMRKGWILGLSVGAVTIPAGCIPLAIWLGEPILDVVKLSVAPHLLYGMTLGWIVAFGLLSREASGLGPGQAS